MKENGFSALNDDSLHIVRSESKIDGFDDDFENQKSDNCKSFMIICITISFAKIAISSNLLSS